MCVTTQCFLSVPYAMDAGTPARKQQKNDDKPLPKIDPKDIGVSFGRIMSEEQFLAHRKKNPNVQVFTKPAQQ